MSRNQDDISKTSKSTLFTEDTSKLEWMYKSGSELLNREEYLLGKTIDRQFEKLDDEEKKQKALPGVTVPKNHVEHECIPYSIRNYRSVQNDEQVDIQRKILEDPLMSIRQKEMESRRRILENPVKLKELHRLLKKEREAGKDLKISKKSSKKKKEKRSKKKKKKESSSSEDEDLDKLLAKKYRQIKEKFGANDGTFNLKDLLGKKGEEKFSDDNKSEKSRKRKTPNRDSDDDSSDEGIPPKGLRHISSQRPQPSQRKNFVYRDSRKSDYHSRSQRKSRNDSNDDSTPDRISKPIPKRTFESNSRQDKTSQKDQIKSNYSRKDTIDKGKPIEHEKDRNYLNNSKYKSVSSKTKISKSDSDSSSSSAPHDDTPPRKNYGLVTASGEKIYLKGVSAKTDSRTGRNEQVKRTQPAQAATNPKRVRLTSEEREKRCREMMQNAELREKERKTKVDTYRKEYDRETNESKDFDKNFINKELHKAMSNQTSVESRLKSNINNIQRSGKAMESNFAKR